MPLYTKSLEPSTTSQGAIERFMAEVGNWIHTCMDRYGDAPAINVHDQGTYASGWEPYVRATGDVTILHFLKQTRDGIRDHYETTGQWRHGYWTMQEAHHGTEHYEIFLGTLLRLDPNDAETARQILDAAEHMVNGSPDVPPWFDEERQRFRSLFFGSDGIRSEPGMDLNTPDHLRCVNICLLAYDASRDRRYLNFAARYTGQWVDAILAAEEIPLGLTPHGLIYSFDGADEGIYRSFMGEVSSLASPVDRAENFLTSDAINLFLRLGQETGNDRFRQATEKLLDVLVTQLTDPDAGAAAAAVRDYRRWTGDGHYDDVVLSAVRPSVTAVVQALTLDTDYQAGGRPSGVGKRSDMPRWLADGAPRRFNPITLAVAAEISGDDGMAIRALDLARVTFTLAREAFVDGRDHGCAARTVSAIARGHGRENHAGMVTAVLGPIANRGTQRIQSTGI